MKAIHQVLKCAGSAFLLLLMSSVAMADVYFDGGRAIKEERWADAYRLFLPEAQTGDAMAQYTVAYLLSEGLGVTQDLTQAAKWYEQSAKGGHDGAKTNLARMYEKGSGVERDLVRATKLYREAAEAGHAVAQNNLGAAYVNGEGVERNDEEAIRWLTKAAEQDDDVAQSTLGMLYCGGDRRPNPVESNTELCNKWLGRAVQLGNEDARQRMFRLTMNGAEKQEPVAMHNVAIYFLQGMGTTANVESGLSWMMKAAAAGLKESQLALSVLFEKGKYGVPVDSEKAQYWESKYTESPEKVTGSLNE